MIIQTLFKVFLLSSLVLSGTLKDSAPMSQPKDQTAAPLNDKETITLGGGCFWCLEAIFDELEGVEQVESGYSGGLVDNPTYKQVCTGTTGHAEAIQITFDPKVISLQEILRVFFTVHDPTTSNRQGPDVGTQYRSVIFYRSNEQKTIAGQMIQEIQRAKLWNAHIVTEIVPFKAFYKAEEYHQEYYKQNNGQPYCSFVIAPKVKKFRELFRDKLKRK